MPLTVVPTYDESVTPPTIIVNVSDGGGGGNPHTVDLHLSFDSTLVKYKSKFTPKSGKHSLPKNGVCKWLAHACPSAGRDFKVGLESRGKGDAWVCAAALDIENGEVNGQCVLIPDKKPSKSPSKKARKA